MSQSRSEALIKEVLTLFMRTESVVRGTRITRDGAVVQPVDDIAAGIESCMRTFKHEGDATKASTQLTQLLNLLANRFKSWEQETQRIERNKVEMNNSPSGAKLKKMAVEATAVKASVQTTLTKMRALITALSQVAGDPTAGSAHGGTENAGNRKSFDVAQLSGWEKLVHELLHGELEIAGKNGSKVAFGARIREQIVDPNLKALLIIQWAPTDKEQLRLRFWLVPKTMEVRKYMKSNRRFSLELNSSRWTEPRLLELAWQKFPDFVPKTEDINTYLELLNFERFPTKAQLGCMFGGLELPIPFSDGVLSETLRLGLV